MITSLTNNKIKEIVKLKENKYMEKEQKFIVETLNLVEEAYKEGILLEVISTIDLDINVPVTLVSTDVMKKISSLKSPSTVIGICKFIKESDNLGNKIMILDGVQDPGNVGTIIRSSIAFNFSSVVLGKGCSNKYNEKLIRSTEGMLFKQNIISRDLLEFIPYLKTLGYKVYTTNVENGILVDKIDKSDKIAVVLGNEGKGVNPLVSDLCDGAIYINMSDKCESLNVSVASSIIMYELSK